MRIVMQATKCSAEAAEQALDKSGYNVKLAILNVLTGADMATAKHVLTEHHGFLRQAIDTLKATRDAMG
jgi:N-acetylmuramic acid 6-phosphate etherase